MPIKHGNRQWNSTHVNADGSEANVVVMSSDGTSLVSGDGNPLIQLSKVSQPPYSISFWGDSRYNGWNGTGVECIGSAVNYLPQRPGMWVAAIMQDAEWRYNLAVSGDYAAEWNLLSATVRTTALRTYPELDKAPIDLLFVNIGVNDCISGFAAATTATYIERICLQAINGGKFVVLETILPVNSGLANYAAVQVLIDAVNALLPAIAAKYPNQIKFVDTATTFKGGTSYALAAYMNADGLHQIRPGAYLQATMLAAAARTFLPRRYGAFLGADATQPNLVNTTSPSPILTQFSAAETGTVTITQSQGQDSTGPYYEWLLVPTVLGSGVFKVRCEASVNFLTSSPPYQSVAINEVTQGAPLLVVDNGAGGAPNAYAITLRQRFFTGSTYNDWGTTVASPTYTDPDYTAAVSVRAVTPRMLLTANSVSATPASSAGFNLNCIIEGQRLTAPTRVRMYPQLKRVAYGAGFLSVTPPATTVAYTNNTRTNQQVVISGGTVTVIAINGVTSGLTAGAFVLSPGDTLTPTYSSAPSMFVKNF